MLARETWGTRALRSVREGGTGEYKWQHPVRQEPMCDYQSSDVPKTSNFGPRTPSRPAFLASLMPLLRIPVAERN